MSRIVGATFVNNEIEPGWEIARGGVLLGKRYRVDLDSISPGVVLNVATGRSKDVDIIMIVSPGLPGFFPLCALKIDGDA